MRLIDADAVPQEFWEYEFDGKWRGCTIKDLLDSQPTIQPEPHWIPVTERLPKEEGFYIVTLEHRYGAETNIRFFKIENGERYWSLWGNENITAWMPKPIPYQQKNEVTE